MMQTRKPSPRAEYRLRQSERIAESTSLSEKFPKLKSLSVDLEFFDSRSMTRNGGMKFKPNLDHAKSLFWFNCPCTECVGGDYDLTEELSQAISKRIKVVKGEKRCKGVRYNRERKERKPCLTVLKFKLSLGY